MTYISLENALWMIEKAYLLSTMILLTVSYVGLGVISKLEDEDVNVLLVKWFS